MIVDGFTHGASAGDIYFLTHFHADHYMGITKRWSAPIHASAITANLVVKRLGVPASLIVILPMDTPVEIAEATAAGADHERRARVTLIDANHCPGAVLLLFQLPDGRNILHTGDFRYNASSMPRHPALRAIPPGGLTALYLDTTYLNPQYRFPTQQAAIRHVVETCRLLLPAQRTLVLFGSYSIGKERVFLEVGRELGVRIGVERSKARLLECMQLPQEDLAVLTASLASTRWRVVTMGHLRAPKLRSILAACRGQFDSVVAFRPSGWCFGRGGGAAGRTVRLGNSVTIVEVPYSEHSSFDEIVACVRDLAPRKVVATVDGGPLGNRHKGMAHLLNLVH
jgi:DNA cross-link repair 1A protein